MLEFALKSSIYISRLETVSCNVVRLWVSTFSHELMVSKIGKLYLYINQQCFMTAATHHCCTTVNKLPRNYPTFYVLHVKTTGKTFLFESWNESPLLCQYILFLEIPIPNPTLVTCDGNVLRLFIFNLELLHSNLNLWNHQLAVLYN